MTEISFTINGRLYKVNGQYGPEMSLNEYIRRVADLRGTKAMCLEGGCGACLVSVTAVVPPTNDIKTFAVNSCLVSVLSCHGWDVTTVEGIGNRTKGYHSVQHRLAGFNGTQCGFCTPGWVTNMYSLYQSKKGTLTTREIENSFAGNMCRCTGYRSIADAFKTFALDVDEKLLGKIADLEDLDMFKRCGVKCNKNCNKCKDNNASNGNIVTVGNDIAKDTTEDEHIGHRCEGKCSKICTYSKYNGADKLKMKIGYDKMIVVDCGDHKWFKAYTLDHVFEAIKLGDYKLVAGNTGQGVYHIESYPKNVIDILNVSELKGFEIDVNLILGAGMSLAEIMEVFQSLSKEKEEFSYLKQLHDHMDLVAHIPVRNIGTIGGNLCMKHENKDFPSDLFLLFETVGGMVTIAESNDIKTTIRLQAFLKLNMTGKVVLNVMLPPLSQCCSIRTFKIMPRSQNAHAIVNAGFLFKFHMNTTLLEKVTIVFGGLSPSFVHASKTEEVLKKKELCSNETLELALKTLSEELVAEEMPPEPSAGFRKMLAISLFYKAVLQLCPENKLEPKYRSGGEVIKRAISQGVQTFDTDKSIWPLNQPIPKLEALVQCSGESVFADDYPTQVDEVFAAFVTADVNPGSVVDGFDATEALNTPGVVGFYTAKDIPGQNTFTPTSEAFMTHDEEILGVKEVKFFGQPFGIIAADRQYIATKAAKLVNIKYASINKNKPLLTIDDVLKSAEKDKRIQTDSKIEPTEKGDDVKKVIKGSFKCEGQYHYTMETQTCVSKPTEDGMEVYSSTQWLDLTNIAIAKCLDVPVNSVNVIVRRVGGGYGSKITRAILIACASALITHLLGRVCRFILPLRDNMKIIGKRLPTACNFEVGVNDDGQIQYLKNVFYQDVGCSFNEAVAGGTVEHFKNGYDTKRWFIEANSVLTDTPSNTWCRAPGSTEGVAMIEYIMEKIAHELKKDALEVKIANMAKDNPVLEMIDKLKLDSNYDERQQQIKQFNESNRWRKRAIKILPLTYTLFYFGNFSCMVSIYHADGTVVVIHGGTEMGQGINTKAAQVCAHKLGVSLKKVSVKPSTSFTSPNATTTGGSIGSECIAFAAVKACDILNDRFKPIKEKLGPEASFEDVVSAAYAAGIDLQASYMCSNTKQEIAPYDIYAVCALEVEVDVLTGNHEVRRVDLVEDTGRSLSPEIDIGQIEGAFVMGLGYWTSEKLIYDSSNGKLLTDRTWTYKPPGIKDIPADMRIYFKRNASNEFGVLQSKATGEPALCLATAVIHALRAAVREARLDAGLPDEWVDIENPCTVENVYTAIGHKLEHFKLK